jgi:hypothetical protein
MLINCQILHDGTDITNHVTAYNRNQNICNGIAMGQLTIDADSGHSFTLYDRIVIYESNIKKVTFYITATVESVEGGTRLLELQDGSKKLQDYFVSVPYEVEPGLCTTSYVIQKYATEANVTVQFDTTYGNHWLNERTTLGPASAMDIIVPMLQQSGWYLYFDANDVCHIDRVMSTNSSIVETLTDNEIVAYSINKNDTLLRNRAVVWGNSSRNGDYGRVFADYSVITPWNYGPNDYRTVVLDGSSTLNQTTADNLAYMMVTEFAKLEEVKVVNLAGFHNISVGDAVRVNSDYGYYAKCLVMEVVSSASASGAITILTLDKRCPRLFAFEAEEDSIEYTYVSTRADGVYRLHTSGSAWEDYSQGIENANVEHLAVYNGKLAGVSVSGSGLSRNESDAEWRVQNFPQVIDENGNYAGGIKYTSCGINQTNGNYLYSLASSTGSSNDYHGARSWMYELTDEREYIQKPQLVLNDVVDVYVKDIDVDYNNKKYVSVDIPYDLFDMPYSKMGIFDVNRGIGSYPALSDNKDIQKMYSNMEDGDETQLVIDTPVTIIPVVDRKHLGIRDSYAIGDKYIISFISGYYEPYFGPEEPLYYIRISEKNEDDTWSYYDYELSSFDFDVNTVALAQSFIYYGDSGDGKLYVKLLLAYANPVEGIGALIYKYELIKPVWVPTYYDYDLHIYVDGHYSNAVTLISLDNEIIYSDTDIASMQDLGWTVCGYHTTWGITDRYYGFFKVEGKMMAVIQFYTAIVIDGYTCPIEDHYYVELLLDGTINRTLVNHHDPVNTDDFLKVNYGVLGTALCYTTVYKSGKMLQWAELYVCNGTTITSDSVETINILTHPTNPSNSANTMYGLGKSSEYGYNAKLVSSSYQLDIDGIDQEEFTYYQAYIFSFDKNGGYSSDHTTYTIHNVLVWDSYPSYYHWETVYDDWTDSHEAHVHNATVVSNEFGDPFLIGYDDRDSVWTMFSGNSGMASIATLPAITELADDKQPFGSVFTDNGHQTLCIVTDVHMVFLPLVELGFGTPYIVDIDPPESWGVPADISGTGLSYGNGLFFYGGGDHIKYITGNFCFEAVENVHTIYSLPAVGGTTEELVDVELTNPFFIESSKKFPLSSINAPAKHTMVDDPDLNVKGTDINLYEVYPPTFPDHIGPLFDAEDILLYRKLRKHGNYIDHKVFDIGIDSNLPEMIVGDNVLGRFVAYPKDEGQIMLYRTTGSGQVCTEVLDKTKFIYSDDESVSSSSVYNFELPKYWILPNYTSGSLLGEITNIEFNNSGSSVVSFSSSAIDGTNHYYQKLGDQLLFEEVSTNFPQSEITEIRMDDAL